MSHSSPQRASAASSWSNHGEGSPGEGKRLSLQHERKITSCGLRLHGCNCWVLQGRQSSNSDWVCLQCFPVSLQEVTAFSLPCICSIPGHMGRAKYLLLLRLLWMVLPGFSREMCSLHAGGERPGSLVSLLSEVLPMRAPAALELTLHCVDPGSSMATGKMGWDAWSYWVVSFPSCDSQQEPSWGRWMGGRHNQHCSRSPNSFKQPWHKAAFELEGSKARDQLLPKGSFGERWIISTE